MEYIDCFKQNFKDLFYDTHCIWFGLASGWFTGSVLSNLAFISVVLGSSPPHCNIFTDKALAVARNVVLTF